MADIIRLPPTPQIESYLGLAAAIRSLAEAQEYEALRGHVLNWIAEVANLSGLHLDAQEREVMVAEAERIELRARDARLVDEADSREFIAREHGFTGWTELTRHLEALADPESLDSRFESAADAIVRGEQTAVEALVTQDADLVKARSARDHRSTLLHYVSANGIEDFRQRTPPNIVEITSFLLEAGADVNATSEAYGGGATTLGLAATSLHPERAGVQIPLLEVLLDHGATMDDRIVRGCLANGQPKAAEFLVPRGAAVDLEAAAGLGRLDLVKERLGGDIGAALEMACWYGRAPVVMLLLERGADPNRVNDRGQTPMHCAAYGGYFEIVEALIANGGKVENRDSEYDATPLDVVVFKWLEGKQPEARYRNVAKLLVQAGAVLDERWREHDGRLLERLRADPPMVEALRGAI